MPDPHPMERDRLLNEISSTLSPTPAGDLAVPPVPPVIPDHQLIRCIGRGSYGEVWIARSVMGSWRAVKLVFRRSFDHDRPFERELDGIRRFEPVSRTHPSQLHILHVGRNAAAGCFYYVMELADAAEVRNPGVADADSRPLQAGTTDPCGYQPRTLRYDLLHRGRLPFDECLRIGLALATALDHLHRHGLVHRDVKPSNIIFVDGIPKLADIGLVARAEATLSMVGTEGYVPPEGPGTPQADLFSLGKVLYEMATGRDRQQYPELPTHLAEQGPTEMARMTELNEIILRACQPDPRQRYQSAAELHADLALLQSGRSVTQIRAMERRLRRVARAGALITLIAALAGLAFLVEQRRTEEARELARQNRMLADTQSRLAAEKTVLAEEQTRLARDLARLGEENRQRIVRLDIANGVRLLDQGDAPGALLWFADALPLLADRPAEASIHRIRIQQTLDLIPRVLQVFPHDSSVTAAAFSPDAAQVATGTLEGQIRLWNAADGTLVWESSVMGTPVRSLRFTRNGSQLLAGSSWEQGLTDGGVPELHGFAVLDAASGRRLFASDTVVPGWDRELVCAHFSPDDRWLATSDGSHVIRVFDLRDHQQVTEIRGHTDEVRFLSFTPDGGLLASASLDRTARLWHLPSGEPAGPPLEHRWPVVRALVTDDGQHLVTATFPHPGTTELGGDGQSEVQVWEVPAGKRRGELIPTGGWLALGVAPGSDGRFLVDGLRTNGARGVHAYAIGHPSEPLLNPDFQGLHAWDFSPDGRRMALANGDYVARVFETHSGRPVMAPLRHGHWGVNAIQFSPDGHRVLTASSDGTARIWDGRPPATPGRRLTLPVPFDRASTANLSTLMGKAAPGTPVSLADGSVQIFDPDLRALAEFSPDDHTAELLPLASARQANRWAVGGYEPGATLPTGMFLVEVQGESTRRIPLEHPGPIAEVTFTHDDRHLLTCGADRRVRFWRTSDGRLERTVEVPPASTGQVGTLSSDGRTALWWEMSAQDSSLERRHLRFLDLESGAVIGDPVSFPAFNAVFSPDGSQLALMSSLGPVWVLESRTGRILSKGIAHSSNLRWVQWASDGRRLLTSGHDDQVLVWDPQTGAQLHGPLRSPGGAVHFARWSPDGRFIVTRNDDRQVRVWDADWAEPVTPRLAQPDHVPWAIMTGDRRVMMAIHPDQLRVTPLQESTLPPDVLVDFAQLAAGRQLSDTGALLVLPPARLAALARSLRQRAPDLFQ